MKNLINVITAKNRKETDDFIISTNNDSPSNLRENYRYLIPKGKDISKLSDEELKAYLIARKQKASDKRIEREVKKIVTVFNSGELVSAKISVEWKKSRTWGLNPTGEAWITYKDKNGNMASNYASSGSIGGCGYDKLSTAIAHCLNQFNEVLRVLYVRKDQSATEDNRNVLGYGSGYGILPTLEGGVGVSCYPEIFKNVGFNFRSVASGKTFDAFEITKL